MTADLTAIGWDDPLPEPPRPPRRTRATREGLDVASHYGAADLDGLAHVASLCGWSFLASSSVLIIVASIDVPFQLWQHTKQLMMTKQEVKDETKETEGDPHTKQVRRQMGYEIATSRMLADVPGADVVVVNPEHYAVALKWQRTRGTAPVCLAKGVDEIAARIRETAVEHGVPIYREPGTARALFASTDIGEEIPVDLYKAVAAAIRFADAMREKARGRFP